MSAQRGELSPSFSLDAVQQRLIVDGLRYSARKARNRHDLKSAAQLSLVADLVARDPAEIEYGRQWLLAAEAVIR